MKKRILASSMASVMALSAASTMVVSSAAVADFKDECVTRGELRNYLNEKEIVDLAENGGVEEFGSYSADRFVKAYSLAKNVVDDNDSTDVDCTVAFLILKEAKANLVQYTKKDVASLVAQCSGIYKTENILNEIHNDTIYKDDSWTKFAEAYENAESYVESDDLRATSDAYEQLWENKDPEKKDTVTKRQIEAARKAYEAALNKEFSYQPWQRGTVKNSDVSDFNGKTFAWGILYAYVKSSDDKLTEIYKDFDSIKGLTETSSDEIVSAVKEMNKAASVINSFSADTMVAGSETKVKSLLKKYHGQLVKDYVDMATATSLPANGLMAIVNQFLTKAKDKDNVAVMIDDQWKTDITSFATVGSYWNVVTSASTTYNPLSGDKVENGKVTGVYKTLSAEIRVRGTKDVWAVVTKDKLPTGEGKIVNASSDADPAANPVYFFTSQPTDADYAKAAAINGGKATDYTYRKISKGSAFVLSDLINVQLSDLRTDLRPTEVLKADLDAKNALVTAAKKIYVDGTTSGKLITLISTIDGALGKIDDVKAAISAASKMAGDPAAETVTAQEKTDAQASLTGIKDALDDLKELASTAKGAITADNIKAIYESDLINEAVKTGTGENNKALNDLMTKVKVLTDGNPSDNLNVKYAVLKTELDKLVTTALETAVDKSAFIDTDVSTDNALKQKLTDAAAAQTAYNDAVAALAEIDTTETSKYAWNNVVDKALEANKNINSDNFAWSAYSNSKTGYSNETVASLALAMTLVDKYYVGTPVYDSTIKKIDGNNFVPNADVIKKTAAAEKLIYNYLNYALADKYAADSITEYGYRQVQAKVDEAYTLQEKTVDTSLFSTSHMQLVAARNDALDWLKERAITKPYVDKKTQVDGKTSTGAYEDLQKKYKQLNDEVANFKYSYEEIAEKMAAVAKAVDDGKGGADLAKALHEVADKFLRVEAVKEKDGTEREDSAAITDDGELKKSNRLYTNDGETKLQTEDGEKTIGKSKDNGTPNHSHYLMKVAYDNMVKLYDAAMDNKPADQKVDDVDGNTDFNLNDVSTLLGYVLNGKADVAKHDYDNSGTVDLTDVSILLKKLLNS